VRVGIGYDIHRFGPDGVLVLGGVRFPGLPRLQAHSDGDVVLHAVADAILGAAALGDIGEHFPDTDERWKDADSAELLGRAAALAAQRAELRPVNVDINVIAERPRLSEKKQQMRARLAEILSLPVENVSVKARSAEGLGPVGSGNAIEAHAVVLLERIRH